MLDAISKGLSSSFRDSIKTMESPYGNGTTSQQIIDIINKYLENGIDLKKKFYDIEFNLKANYIKFK